jgi:hypothetical protein
MEGIFASITYVGIGWSQQENEIGLSVNVAACAI